MQSVEPKTNAMASLELIFIDIQLTEEKWSKEVFWRVFVQFEKLLRSGWPRSLATYCEIFKLHMSLDNLKKKASQALNAKSGRKCTAREFKKEAVKRVKTLDAIFEKNTLSEGRIYNEVRKTFLECKQERDDGEVESTERSRKVPNGKINHLIFEAVFRAVGECVRSKPPSTMTQITKIIQAPQLSYQRVSTKQFRPSA